MLELSKLHINCLENKIINGIVIIGGTGTGKSTVGNILSLRTGYKLYEIGHVVKSLYLRKMQDEARSLFGSFLKAIESVQDRFKKNSKDIFTNLRLDYVNNIVRDNGVDYFVKKLLELYFDKNIIIIGARSIEEIKTIRSRMEFPFFVGLTCGESKLIRRFIIRESDFMQSNKAGEIFEKRRWIENIWGVEEVLDECNIIISTDNIIPSDLATVILDEYRKYVEEKSNLKSKIIYDNKKIIY
jgi:dephospho-CoA kinase